jgi:hypothetical protein
MTNKAIGIEALLDWIAQNQFECDEGGSPPPPPPPSGEQYKVLTLGNFRTSPGVGTNLIRTIQAGEIVTDLGGRVDDWWNVRDKNNVSGWFWTNNQTKLQKVS